MLCPQHIDLKHENLGSGGGRFGFEGVFHMAIEKVVEKRAHVRKAPRFVDDADNCCIFGKRHDDVADIESSLLFASPEKELVRTDGSRSLATTRPIGPCCRSINDSNAAVRASHGESVESKVIVLDISKPLGHHLVVHEFSLAFRTWPATGFPFQRSLQNPFEIVDGIEEGGPAFVAAGARSAFGENPPRHVVRVGPTSTSSVSIRTRPWRGSRPCALRIRRYQTWYGPDRQPSSTSIALDRDSAGSCSSAAASAPSRYWRE